MNENTTQEVDNTQNNTQVDTVEPTLDDLYKESGLEQAAQPQTQTQTQVQTTQVQTEYQPNVPDPFDIDNHRNYLANLEKTLRETQKSQAEISNAMAAERQKAQFAQLEADIKQASDYVAKESGIDNPDLATFELNRLALTDPKFKALWDGRNASPQSKGAFTKALGVISKQIAKKYEVRADPQLVANRQRLAAARQTSATTSQESSSEPEWGSLNGQDFQRNWDLMIRNNN